MSGRKVIQVAISPDGPETYGSIIALCDDGTIWRLPDRLPNEWEQVKGPPQDEEEA